MTDTIPPSQPPGTVVPINVPMRLDALPAPTVECGQGVSFSFETDEQGWIVAVVWHHTRVSDGAPCTNQCYLNLSTLAPEIRREQRPLFDVFMWSPFTVAKYWSCYATDGKAVGCGRHGLVIGSRWLEV